MPEAGKGHKATKGTAGYSPDISYGGQAVLEGVMMRGPQGYAVAVRREDGRISTRYTERPSVSKRFPLLGLVFIRGTAVLVDSLVVGIDSLLYSANEAVGEDEQLSAGESALAMVIALVAAVGLFMLLPTVAAGPLAGLGASPVVINLAEGFLRLGILVTYVWAIGHMPDIRRVYQYHGAEHKVINAYSDTGRVSASAAAAYETAHPRCGTSFLLFVVVVSVAVFSLLGWPNIWLRIASRLAFLPVVAGLAYETIRLGDRSKSPLVRWLVAPGLWLQRLTTREPDEDQLEVAAAALKALNPPVRLR